MSRPGRPRGNLPAELTSFVGRQDDLAALRSRFATARHITLVGVGGVGKSRLAVRSAAQLERNLRDGAWLVELADVRDPALVGDTMLAALDLRAPVSTEPVSLLCSYLRDKELLLVVDNCEHLAGAVARVITDVLTAAPAVRVLATSREPLGMPGEHVVPVRPLALPEPDSAEPLDRLRSNEAVFLFTDRAAAASGSFELTASNREIVVELCRTLDGVPLAIELAAVRTRALSVDQIVDRLSDRLGLLTGGGRARPSRHRTLRAAFEWSHDLLTDRERVLFRRLSVFAGRFTLDDAEAVCAAGTLAAEEVLNVLSSLVDKSLVGREDVSRHACYRLHETTREFARSKLAEAGDDAGTERRFDAYYRVLCERSSVQARSSLVEWLAWMDLERDNVRSLLERSLSRGDGKVGLEVATFLWWYWTTRATSEGVRWLDVLLPQRRHEPSTHGWSLFVRGFLAVLQGDAMAARPVLRRAAEMGRASGQVQLVSQALAMASIAEIWAGDRAEGSRLIDEARVASAETDEIPVKLGFLQAQALHGFAGDDLDAVRSAATEGARLSREANDVYVLNMMLLNLSLAMLMTGDLRGARQSIVEGLRTANLIDDRVAQSLWLDALGCHAVSSGQPRIGAQLLGAADRMRTEAGATVNAIVARLLHHAEASAKNVLGAARFEAELEAGRLLSRHEALTLALGERAHAGSPTVTAAERSLLSGRQMDVAKLVADGLTNKQIGARLFISERTVDSHVRGILNKLGVSTRAQIAAWMTSAAAAGE